MIDEKQARILAERFLGEQDLRDFTYKCSGVKYDKRWSNEWGVIFDVYSPQKTLIDGPIVLVVDKTTGEVRTTQ